MNNMEGLVKIGIMLAGIVLGAMAGEAAEYIIWTTGDFAVSYCAEQDVPPEWHEICLKNLGNYNEVKPAFQIVGVIVGLVVSVIVVKRLFD
jgi:hypothetical protein